MPIAQTEPWVPPEPDVMDIAGSLDDVTAPALEEDVLLCVRSGARRMVLDCRDLAYISGAGLRAILTLARAMEKAEGRLVVCALQPQVEEMFALSALAVLVPVYGDRDEAIAALTG